MKARVSPLELLLFSGFFLLFILACSLVDRSRFFPSIGRPAYSSNGERIYYTATNIEGERIRYSGGPAFGGMMSSVTCASCHGSDGRGGIHAMHMQVMDAPDIRWSILSSGEHGEHGDDEPGEEREAIYDETDFMRAIREGIAPNRHPLSRDMPRWEMNDEDIQDLIGYLKSMP
jgi:hypothetical protein